MNGRIQAEIEKMLDVLRDEQGIVFYGYNWLPRGYFPYQTCALAQIVVKYIQENLELREALKEL